MLYMLIARPQGDGKDARFNQFMDFLQDLDRDMIPMGPKQFLFKSSESLYELAKKVFEILDEKLDQALLADMEQGKFIERNVDINKFKSFKPDSETMAKLFNDNSASDKLDTE